MYSLPDYVNGAGRDILHYNLTTHSCSTVSDVYAGETLEHDFCDEAAEDGIYVEVTEDEPYCTRDSKVYVVQDGEVVYEETLSEYGDEFESYFE